ncbi:MAG: hypothetical protein ACRCYE_05185 [Sarcina sp.]
MENHKLEIHTHEDYELLEDVEEREEAQENFEDEIEAVCQFLKFKEIDFEQITDNIFSIEINSYKDRNNDAIIAALKTDLEMILEQKDIAFFTLENYANA